MYTYYMAGFLTYLCIFHCFLSAICCYFRFLIGVPVRVYISPLRSVLLYYLLDKDFCFSLCHSFFFLNTFFQFLRDLDDEISAIKLEEESLKRKMNGKFLAYHSARRN